MDKLNDFVELSRKQLHTQELEEQTQTIEKELKEEKLKGRIQDREERKRYAKSTFSFLKRYTNLMILIIFLSGANGSLWCLDLSKFYLSDTVLVTLISTSLASIVGIFAFVMKYLFKK